MPARTSQLQIRVTEQEKAALKRLAAAAHLTVSRYVLAQALPSRDRELVRAVEALAEARGGVRASLGELADLLSQCTAEDFQEALSSVPVERLSPVLGNQVAAMVEQAAHAKSVEPPAWVEQVPKLGRPHFGWPLASLRPHQIRVTPVPFKRRGVFFDPASPRGVPSGSGLIDRPRAEEASESQRRLGVLEDELRSSELKVEFYFLGGAVLHQAFHARPPTARLSAQLRPPDVVTEVLATLAARHGWPTDWLSDAVKEYLAGGARPGRYLELANLAVFVPPLEYVLALKVAALGLGTGAGALDDLRYVLRGLNLTEAGAALEITRRYFGERQLPPDARRTLEGLLGA